MVLESLTTKFDASDSLVTSEACAWISLAQFIGTVHAENYKLDLVYL